MMSVSIPTLGLIAGNGKFPILLARNLKSQNIKIKAVGIKGDTSVFLKPLVEELVWIDPGELRRLFEYFKKEGIHKVVMAGQVNPKNLFDGKRRWDDDLQSLLAGLPNRKADTIFGAIADKLKKEGIELLDSTFFLTDHLSPKGTLTRRAPTLKELADIEFGWTIAKAMGELDVGQTVVVKEKAILAIEAMEGTDRTILRGGKIARSGAVVVKMSKPRQDHRFDVPVVGPKTIRTMRKVKAGCLAIEAGKTLLLERESLIRLADQARICVVAA